MNFGRLSTLRLPQNFERGGERGKPPSFPTKGEPVEAKGGGEAALAIHLPSNGVFAQVDARAAWAEIEGL